MIIVIPTRFLGCLIKLLILYFYRVFLLLLLLPTMFQCCSKYYCIVCLQISVSDYENLSNPTLHWFCPKCESKVMKNVRLDHELEARCNEFCKAMETRVVKLEKEIKDKASVSQLTKPETDVKGKADARRGSLIWKKL